MVSRTMVRSQLEYAGSLWMPYRTYLIDEVEKVKKGNKAIYLNILQFT